MAVFCVTSFGKSWHRRALSFVSSTVYGIAFIREGEMTRRADIATLREMIMRREVEPERWERRFSNADLHDDLDATCVGCRSGRDDKA